MSRVFATLRFPRLAALTTSFTLLLALSTTGLAQQAKTPAKEKSQPKADSHDINAQFADPDVKAFVKRFETEEREVYAQRANIVRALEIKPGTSVADIGAGTGLFTRLIAKETGSEGRVYAVDISPGFLKYIAEESKRLNQKQVRTIKASRETAGLTVNSIDMAFMCDVYHHLERPIASLRSIHDALKKDGELVVVEFDRVQGKSTEFVLKHVRADKAQFTKEIQSAGFMLLPTPNAPRLSENFFLRFRKIDRAPTSPEGPVGE